jgi:hypothetical protein
MRAPAQPLLYLVLRDIDISERLPALMRVNVNAVPRLSHNYEIPEDILAIDLDAIGNVARTGLVRARYQAKVLVVVPSADKWPRSRAVTASAAASGGRVSGRPPLEAICFA